MPFQMIYGSSERCVSLWKPSLRTETRVLASAADHTAAAEAHRFYTSGLRRLRHLRRWPRPPKPNRRQLEECRVARRAPRSIQRSQRSLSHGEPRHDADGASHRASASRLSVDRVRKLLGVCSVNGLPVCNPELRSTRRARYAPCTRHWSARDDRLPSM